MRHPLIFIIKSFLRYFKRRRSLSLLQLLGVACGAAAVIGMTLSARSALSSFTDAVMFLQGRATHTIERTAGPLDEKILAELMRDRAVLNFSPVIDRKMKLEDETLIRVLGVDPFLDRDIRPEFARMGFSSKNDSNQSGNLDFLLDERAVFLEAGIAGQLGVSVGGEMNSSKGSFKIAGIFSNPSEEPLILMDIFHAQEIFSLTGYVDHVDLILTDEADFVSRWEKGFQIRSSKQKTQTFKAMVRAFRLNLEALSLMALLVAVFLIYNTTMFTVVSRKRDVGILRSMGVSRKEIIIAFLVEILILGALGGALGGVAGYILSFFLTKIVGGAISNIYFFLRPISPSWSVLILFSGILLGCLASILGGIYPLVELVRANPVAALQGRAPSRRSAKTALNAAWIGIFIVMASVIILAASGRQVYPAFAATFLFLLGASLVTGFVLAFTAPFLKLLLVRIGGLSGRIAAGNIRQNLGRSGVAVAAFMMALSMLIGLDSMIGSFRESLSWWMGTQLRGDLYVSTASEMEVPLDFYREILSDPRIDGVDAYRRAEIEIDGKTAYITAIRSDVLKRFSDFAWFSGGNEHWDEVSRGDVIVSESFVRNFNIRTGDNITLKGNRGLVKLRVAAAFYDYTTEHGLIIMDRNTYISLFDDQAINSISIFIDPDNLHKDEIIDKVRKMARQRGLPVFTKKQLYNNVLQVFDSTFAVTRSMKIITVIIAFFGIAGALMTLFIERRRDFGILRSLGFSTGQVSAMTLLEALGMGFMSFLLSALVGTAFAFILIKVINLRSFNWTIFFYLHWQPYVTAAVTAILASVAAALYPIWKVRKTYPHIQMREE
jgi:putative ABC transport system permease protein